jgi:hypothetical protein
MTSVIANVNGAVAKTMTMGMVVIRMDTIAVVNTKGTVAGCGLISSGARIRSWPCNDEGGPRLCSDTSRKRRRRHGGVWETNAGHTECEAVANNMNCQGQQD